MRPRETRRDLFTQVTNARAFRGTPTETGDSNPHRVSARTPLSLSSSALVVVGDVICFGKLPNKISFMYSRGRAHANAIRFPVYDAGRIRTLRACASIFVFRSRALVQFASLYVCISVASSSAIRSLVCKVELSSMDTRLNSVGYT